MVSVLASSVVDRGFIGGVMVSVVAPSAVDRGFEFDKYTYDQLLQLCTIQEEFEDTKGVIRSRKSKMDRQDKNKYQSKVTRHVLPY